MSTVLVTVKYTTDIQVAQIQSLRFSFIPRELLNKLVRTESLVSLHIESTAFFFLELHFKP